MGKFRPKQYDPRQDSSPGAADYYTAIPRDQDTAGTDNPGWYADEAIILIQFDHTAEATTCLCGCGEAPVGKDSHFRMGHDARLRGKLIRAHLLGLEVVRVTGGLTVSGSAIDYAKTFGWECYLEDAWDKEHDRVQRSIDGANKAVLAKATGPQIGGKVLIKVGRWPKTGQVAAIYDDGDSIEVEYVDGKGNTKTIRKPKTEVQVEA